MKRFYKKEDVERLISEWIEFVKEKMTEDKEKAEQYAQEEEEFAKAVREETSIPIQNVWDIWILMFLSQKDMHHKSFSYWKKYIIEKTEEAFPEWKDAFDFAIAEVALRKLS